MRKLVYGVGINDANYKVQIYEELPKICGTRKRKLTSYCPFYRAWVSMLARCFSKKILVKRDTYLEVTVCNEWLTFSKFKDWMTEQDWIGNCLDKDILFDGNKIYSPNTCCFVSNLVNVFVIESNSARGEFLIGVSLHIQCNKFQASCSQLVGKQKYLGLFNTEQEAHQVWLKEKLRLAYILASQQKDERVAKALIDRYENYKSKD